MKMNEDETNVIEDETDDDLVGEHLREFKHEDENNDIEDIETDYDLGGKHLRGDGTATGGA